MPPWLCKKSLSLRAAPRWRPCAGAARRGAWAIASSRRIGPPRLAFGLERFPDHRRARIVARPGAEDPLAGAPVDPHHADPGGARNGTTGMSFERGRGRTGWKIGAASVPPWA